MVEKFVKVIKNFEYEASNITIKLDDLKINVKTNGKITLFDFAFYMIKNLKIIDYEYERKVPYKLYKKNIHGNTPSEFISEYRMNWLMPNDNKELIEHDALVIPILTHSMHLPEEFECFICDLLEVFLEREYIKRISEKKFDINYINSYARFEEIDLSKSPEVLKERGYTVPSWYENYYNEELKYN